MGSATSASSSAHDAWLQGTGLSSSGIDSMGASASRSSLREGDAANSKPKTQRWSDASTDRHKENDQQTSQKPRSRPWAEPTPELRRSSLTQKKKTNDAS
jgi:hypothetical protein